MVDYPSGWTCTRTAEQFKPYLLGLLLLRDALAVAEHLEACGGCSEQLVVYRVTVSQGLRG